MIKASSREHLVDFLKSLDFEEFCLTDSMHNLADDPRELLDFMSLKKRKDINSFKKFGFCDEIDNNKQALVRKL